MLCVIRVELTQLLFFILQPISPVDAIGFAESAMLSGAVTPMRKIRQEEAERKTNV